MSEQQKLYDLIPVEVVSYLTDITTDLWADRLRNDLQHTEPQIQGKALIALALWHKDEDAPFNTHRYQRDFWGNGIRHSLASYNTLESAANSMSYLAPLALAITEQQSSVANFLTLAEHHHIANGSLAAKALQIAADVDLEMTVPVAHQLLTVNASIVQASASTVLALAASEACRNGKTEDALELVKPFYALVINGQADFGLMNHIVKAMSELPADISKPFLFDIIRNSDIDAVAAAIDYLTRNHPFTSDVSRFLNSDHPHQEVDIIKKLIERVKDQNKILLVDDEESSLQLMELALERCGYKVIVAHTANMGITKFRDEQPRIVISDFLMPGMDGIEMIEAIYDITKRYSIREPLVLLMTARLLTREQLLHYMKLGIGNFLNKPLPPNELISGIDELLKGEQT